MQTRNILKTATLAVLLALAATGAKAANTWTNNTGFWSDAPNWDVLPLNDGTADAIMANPAPGNDTITLTEDWSIHSLTFNGAINATLNNSAGSVLSIGSGGITNTGSGIMFLSAPIMFTTSESRITAESLANPTMYTFMQGPVDSSAVGGTVVHLRTVGWPREFKPETGMSTTTNVTWSLESGALAIYASDKNVLGKNAVKITGDGANTRGVHLYGGTTSNHIYFDTPIEFDARTLSHSKRFDWIGGVQVAGASTGVIMHVRGQWTLVNGVITNTSGPGPIWLNGILDSRSKVYYEADNSGLVHQAAVGDNSWSSDIFIYNGHHVIANANAFGVGNNLFFNLGDQSGGVSSATNRSLLATSGNNVAAGIRIFGGSADSGGGRLNATLGLEGAGAVEFSGKIFLDGWADANAAKAHNLVLTAPSNGTLTVSGVIGMSIVNGGTNRGSANITGGGKVILEASNTYTPITTVMSNSTLQVDGSVMSKVFVDSGSTVQGIGTIYEDLTVSGDVAPGDSIGILSVSGNVKLNSGAYFTAEIGALNASDLLDVSGNLDIGGAILRLRGTASGTFTIASYLGSLTGTFASIDVTGLGGNILDPTYGTGGIDYAANNGSSISVSVIPEPASILLLLSGFVGAYKLRRRS